MIPSTIPEVIDDAQTLYTSLTTDINVNLALPVLNLTTEFVVPDWETIKGLEEICPMTVGDLTTGIVGGTGVFDEIMKAVTAHLHAQFEKNRITGADYAKVYLGSVQAAMQQGIAFLMGKDKAYLENLALQEAVRLALIMRTRALAELELVRANLQIAQYTAIKMQLEAYTARNQYALSKMALVSGYNGVLTSEAQVLLIGEQYETQRAQIRDTNSAGQPILGILLYEKNLKRAQTQLVEEQYESQRGQSRDTLSTGLAVNGLIGAQRLLYIKQTWAYERDSEAKFIKMIMDTWTARKTIDEGVAVPVQIDVPKIDELVDQARAKLDFTG